MRQFHLGDDSRLQAWRAMHGNIVTTTEVIRKLVITLEDLLIASLEANKGSDIGDILKRARQDSGSSNRAPSIPVKKKRSTSRDSSEDFTPKKKKTSPKASSSKSKGSSGSKKKKSKEEQQKENEEFLKNAFGTPSFLSTMKIPKVSLLEDWKKSTTDTPKAASKDAPSRKATPTKSSEKKRDSDRKEKETKEDQKKSSKKKRKDKKEKKEKQLSESSDSD